MIKWGRAISIHNLTCTRIPRDVILDLINSLCVCETTLIKFHSGYIALGVSCLLAESPDFKCPVGLREMSR